MAILHLWGHWSPPVWGQISLISCLCTLQTWKAAQSGVKIWCEWVFSCWMVWSMSVSLRPHGLYSPWDSPGQNTRMGSLSLLQWLFPTQELNQGLLRCRQILYQLSYQGSPSEIRVTSQGKQEPSCSVTQPGLTLCDPVDCSTPGFPVLHHLSELAQTHVYWVGDTTQPLVLCRPLLLPSIFTRIRVFYKPEKKASRC